MQGSFDTSPLDTSVVGSILGSAGLFQFRIDGCRDTSIRRLILKGIDTTEVSFKPRQIYHKACHSSVHSTSVHERATWRSICPIGREFPPEATPDS
jgi:hypothetical protein